MHLDHGGVPHAYLHYVGGKRAFAWGLVGATILLGLVAIALGAVRIPLADVVTTLLGNGASGKWRTIVWEIRLPQALAAVMAGGALALAGTATQALLRNPLGSPFTLGISHAAAFGGAFAIIVLGAGRMQSQAADAIRIASPFTATFCAFACSMAATGAILALARLRRGAPEVMILSGVALGSLFTAGTMYLQMFADDSQVAAALFWSFGDLSRAGWREVGIMGGVLLAAYLYYFRHRLDFNAILAGDETARSLGVSVRRLRLVGMTVASLLASVAVAFLGVIGFVGLICPHLVRRFIGDDHRFLLPAATLAGSCLLLAADTAARTLLAPRSLPVAVLTAFLGTPVFIALVAGKRAD